MPHPPTPALLERLGRELPADALLRDPSDLAEYGRDWTRSTRPRRRAIALPAHHRRGRAAAARSATRRGVAGRALGRPHRPRGRRGGRATASWCSRSRACAGWTRSTCSARTVRVQAGAVTEAVHQHCAPHGLTWPVDFASKGSSQVGGNIATNAGGVKVIRYGLTRQWVLGLAGGARRAARCSSSTARSRRTTPASTCASSSSAARAPRRHHRGDAQARARCRRKLDVLLLRGAPTSPAVLALFRDARSGAVHHRGLRVLHRPLPRARAAPPQAALAVRRRRTATTCCSRSRTPTTTRSRPGSASLFERGLVTDGTLAQNAAQAARAVGAARGHQREPLAPPGCRTRTTSRCRSPRSRRSAPSSTRVFARALPGLGDLPLRPHRRRQPARQRDEARRAGQGRRSSRARQEADHDDVRAGAAAPRQHLRRARHRPAQEALPRLLAHARRSSR